jgi:hypothetical protein
MWTKKVMFTLDHLEPAAWTKKVIECLIDLDDLEPAMWTKKVMFTLDHLEPAARSKKIT